ncbi:TonB-dependent receptor, partial [bacterium]|nr:TonB-dependent receptor [bacterium]
QYENKKSKNILFNYFEQNLFYTKNDRVQRVDIFDNDFKDIQSYTTKNGDMWSLGGNAHIVLNYGKKSNLIFGYDTLYKTLKSENNYYLKDFVDGKKYYLIDHGVEFKDNNQFQIAFFAQNESSFGNFTIITSIRGDYFKTEGFYPEKWDSSSKNWNELSTTESSFSGNIGILYSPISKFAMKLNLSRSFRAPDLREIFFAGANCYGYTCGNPNLKPESSLNIDFSTIFSPKWIDFEINSFIYFVDNFINFSSTKDSNVAEICELQYQNTNKSLLAGVESKIGKKIKVIPEKIVVQAYFSTSYIYAKDLENDTPISSIPPLNINIGLKISGNIQKFGKYHFGLSINHENEQNRVADGESQSDSYTIYNIQSGLQIPLKSIFTQFKISFNIENIADLKYKTHLSTPYRIGREFKLNTQLSF